MVYYFSSSSGVEIFFHEGYVNDFYSYASHRVVIPGEDQESTGLAIQGD